MSGNRTDTLSEICIRNNKVGRPRKTPKEVYADRAYDSKNTREYLRDRDIISNIPANKKADLLKLEVTISEAASKEYLLG
jgi:hypothetical protein